jgi:hypothetical protein
MKEANKNVSSKEKKEKQNERLNYYVLERAPTRASVVKPIEHTGVARLQPRCCRLESLKGRGGCRCGEGREWVVIVVVVVVEVDQ